MSTYASIFSKQIKLNGMGTINSIILNKYGRYRLTCILKTFFLKSVRQINVQTFNILSFLSELSVFFVTKTTNTQIARKLWFLVIFKIRYYHTKLHFHFCNSNNQCSTFRYGPISLHAKSHQPKSLPSVIQSANLRTTKANIVDCSSSHNQFTNHANYIVQQGTLLN